ncbi:MAG TPA: HEAT repeat domain-containing protein [Tahibacter sp.]|nr:HEAT repeat domain-containing protein [Tahibacter sp.]
MKKSLLHKALFAILLGASGAAFAVPAADGDMAPNDKVLNTLYWQGHEALKKSEWTVALKRFETLEQELKSKEPQSADAAVYWQAYALAQAKRSAESKATVERLHRDFPKSRWGKEADALLRQAPQPAAAQAELASGDDDLAQLAVEGLMSAPPQRALPLLTKVIKGKYSIKVKKRALFVASQLDDPGANDLVVQAARGDDADLRGEAIRMLGISGDDGAIGKLSEIFRTSKSASEKREVIQAWLIADRKDLVLDAVREEKDPAVQSEAINALGAMGGTAELKQLFASVKEPENQKRIVQALGVAGDTKALAEIVAGNSAEETRIEALQSLGVAGGSAELVKLYPSANTQALRDGVLQGLLIAGDGKGMAALYRQAKSKEEKQAILRMLSVMGDEAALDVIEQELK